MLGRSALLAATNSENYGNWLGNYSDVSLLLRNGTPLLVPFDESPTPKTITAVGNASVTTAVARWNQGSGGSSLVFDGNGDYFTIPSNSALAFDNGNFTCELWVYHSSLSGQQTYLSDAFGNTSGVYLYKDITHKVGLYYSSQIITGTSILAANSWYHIALCRASGTVRLFVNGNLEASAPDNTNLSQPILSIGGYASGDWFNGYIDDLRITKGIARYETGTGANAGKMVFAGTNNLALPTTQLPANTTDDPSYNSVSLLLRGNGTPGVGNPPLDESPTPKTITAVGNASVTTAVARWNQGSGGSSLVFDGSGDYFTVPDGSDFNFGTGDFTVEMWVYLGQLNRFHALWANGPVQIGSFAVYINSANKLEISYYSNFLIFGQTALQLNTWHHVAVTRQSSVTRVFLDGLLDASDPNGFNNTTNQCLIGDFWGVSLNGYIDDLRITKGIARYVEGTGANLGKMVFAGTNTLAVPNDFGEFQTNSGPNPDPSYNSVSLLLRNGTPSSTLVPFDESPTPKVITAVGNASVTTAVARWNQGSGGSSLIQSSPANDRFNFTNIGNSLELTGDYTIEFWIYLPSMSLVDSSIYLISNTAVNVFHAINIDAMNFNLYLNTGLPAFSIAHNLSSLTWHHVAICRSGSIVRVFTAGLHRGSTTSSTTHGYVQAGVGVCQLGGGGSGTRYLDDFRITKGIARYTSNFTPPPAELPNF